MDGYTLLYGMRQVLSEGGTSVWLNPRLSYDCLYQAAVATVERINYPSSSQNITTLASTSAYTLEADFLKPYLQDDQNRYFIKYNNGSSTSFINPSSYDSIYLGNNSTPVGIPNTFAIKDATDLTQKTGTATATGSLTNAYSLFGQTLGETTLTDAAADFSSVRVGDLVHNTTDGSHGLVVALSTSTAVICALFEGTGNFFAIGDAYIINPQKRFSLVVDPPSLTAGHTITVPYIQKPNPVYSFYRRYSLPSGYEPALQNYAAWLYKYRDGQPNKANPWFQFWDREVRRLGTGVNTGMDRTARFRVNFIKRAYRDRSIR